MCKLVAINNLSLCSVFDRDSNGYITRDELSRAMQMIGESVTEAQLSDMLALADLDKDGKINYEGKLLHPVLGILNQHLPCLSEFARLLL